MLRWAAVLVALAAPAAAEPARTLRGAPAEVIRGQLAGLESILDLVQTLQHAPLEDLVRDAIARSPDAQLLLAFLLSNRPKAIVADVVATGTGGVDGSTASGDLTAVLRGRVIGDYCDVIGGSLAVRGGGASGQGIAGEVRAQAGFCLWNGIAIPASAQDDEEGLPWPMSLFPLSMTGELALNAAPRFGALRNQPRRRYSEVTYGFAVEGLRLMPTALDRGLSFIYANFDQRWEWPGWLRGDRSYETVGGFGFVRLFRMRDALALADRAIDIIDIRLHGMRFDESVAIIDAYPLRLRGLGLFRDRILLDADLGLTASGGTISASNCLDDTCVDEDIMTGENVADVTTWVTDSGLSIGTQLRGGGARFTRRLDSNALGQLTVETRGTVWLQAAIGPVVARADAFGGRATHYLDVDARGRESFFGGAVDAQYQLSPALVAGLQVDAVRVFDRDAVLEERVAGSGLRTLVTLTYTHALGSAEVDLDLSALTPPPAPPVEQLPAEPPPPEAPAEPPPADRPSAPL